MRVRVIEHRNGVNGTACGLTGSVALGRGVRKEAQTVIKSKPCYDVNGSTDASFGRPASGKAGARLSRPLTCETLAVRIRIWLS